MNTSRKNQPNIVFMLMDNLGYGDAGCYGSCLHRTPHVDRLAAEGMQFTHYYSCSGVCTPSRASLMTGCYPRRVNLHCSADNHCVLMPNNRKGLHPDEITIADILRGQGYATGIVGKWHLGDQPPFLPTRHGFDAFFGCPYSEDMIPDAGRGRDWPPLPLMRDETVIEAPPDRNLLTRRYTETAVRFVRDHAEQPFFLYLPHAMPGSSPEPFASPGFRGRSANGIYGDCVEELDWSVGEILGVLEELGLDENTLLVWTSDNGAVRLEHQGSNAPLKGWGYNTSEGAQRVPCLARWPNRIPAGTVRHEVATMMDWLPTFAALAGGRAPTDRKIDGHDLSTMLLDASPQVSPYDKQGFFYYHVHQLQAVRSGPWKLYLPLDHKLEGLAASRYKQCAPSQASLYNLEVDVAEQHDLAAKHPDVVERLAALAVNARQDLGDIEREGAGQRPAGWVDHPTPRTMTAR